jgi:hypothetical protein
MLIHALVVTVETSIGVPIPRSCMRSSLLSSKGEMELQSPHSPIGWQGGAAIGLRETRAGEDTDHCSSVAVSWPQTLNKSNHVA